MSYPQQQNPPTVIYVTTTPAVTAPVGPPPIQANTKWRNKPQSNATAAGGLIFLSGGMNMALSVGWAQYTLYGAVKHFCYSWFIGVIIGTIVSIILRSFLTKRLIMGASTLLIIIGGILFVSSPYSYDALLAGRYLNGIAIGVATVPFLMNASEIADNTYRGSCLAIEQYSISFGIAIQMIYSSYWSVSVDFPANRLHGILDIVYAILAAGSLVYFVESPIDQIVRGNDAAALDSLARLRRPQMITLETNALLEENKAYVREHASMSVVQSLTHGILPLVKLLVVRSMMLAFCFSMPLNLTLQFTVLRTGNTWSPTVAGICRIVGGLLSVILVDSAGRKLPTVISVVIIGSLLIGIASIFQSFGSILSFSDMSTAQNLFIVLQLFAGFFTPYTSIFMGEAFPLKVKAFLMDVCVIVEQILQIIFIETINAYVGDSLMAQGIIVVVAFLFLCLTLPETRNTSLSEANRRFRKLLNLSVR